MQYETMDIFYSFYSIAHGTLWYSHYIVGGHESDNQRASQKRLGLRTKFQSAAMRK